MERYVGRYRIRGPRMAARDARGRDDERGERVGSHPYGCQFSQDDDGVLHVVSARGDHVCEYAPAQYELREDGEMIHIHKIGEHDASRHERVPVQDRLPPVRVSAGGDTVAEFAGLRRMNEYADRLRSRGFWAR